MRIDLLGGVFLEERPNIFGNSSDTRMEYAHYVYFLGGKLEKKDEESIIAACKFLGYGNPKAALWFVGIEEGALDFQANVDEILRSHRQPNDAKKPVAGTDCLYSSFTMDQHWEELSKKAGSKRIRRTPSSTWVYAAKISALTFGEYKSPPTYGELEDRFKNIGSEDGFTFFSDVFPLAKPKHRDWPYPFDQDEYKKLVVEERFRRLQKARPDGSVVVGFGTSVWKYIEQIFCHPNDPQEVLNENRAFWPKRDPNKVVFKVHRESRVILCPFFSNRKMNRKAVEKVSQLIREFVQPSR